MLTDCSLAMLDLYTVDFAKAFDTVEHSTLMLMMEDLGFPQKWLQWSARKTIQMQKGS